MIIALGLASCTDSPTAEPGGEGAACLPSSRCHAGLTCASKLCVRLADAGAPLWDLRHQNIDDGPPSISPDSTPHQAVSLELQRLTQPLDTITCGPTSLRMVLDYHGGPLSHAEVMEHFTIHPGIGVLDPHIALAALDLGYQVKIISYNTRVFHPSWEGLPPDQLLQKLETYLPQITNDKDKISAEGYIEYLTRGGVVEFHPLSRPLLLNFLQQGLPLIAALDMEYLYQGKANWSEFSPEHYTHFVVIHGYDSEADAFEISDPWYDIPAPDQGGHYFSPAPRLFGAILLGAQVNDADLVILQPAP